MAAVNSTVLCTRNFVKRDALLLSVLSTIFKKRGEDLEEEFREHRHVSYKGHAVFGAFSCEAYEVPRPAVMGLQTTNTKN